MKKTVPLKLIASILILAMTASSVLFAGCGGTALANASVGGSEGGRSSILSSLTSLSVGSSEECNELGHDFTDATCTTPERCKREGCGATGDAKLGHSMIPATCTEATYCTRCSATYGKPLGHLIGSDGACEREACGVTFSAGLYKEDGALVATWEELIAAGLDVTADHAQTAGAKADANSGWTVLHEHETYKNGTVLVIPHTYTYNGETYEITSIGKYAFAACDQLTLVVISDGITNIGERAFNNCTGLTRLDIPANVTAGTYAFNNIGAVTVNIGANFVSGTYAFASCAELETVVIAEGCTRLQYGMFQNCSKLSSVTVPSTVTTVNGQVFMNCTSLNTVTVPASVTTIAATAFKNCRLASFIYEGTETAWNATAASGSTGVPAVTCSLTVGGVTADLGHNIGSTNVCLDCGSTLAAGLYDADGKLVTAWDALAAAGVNVSANYSTTTGAAHSALFGAGTQLILPETQTVIGEYAFYGSTLSKIVLSSQTTTIGKGAFQTSKISSIVIPASVISMGDSCLRYCPNLTEVIFEDGIDLGTMGSYMFYMSYKLTSIVLPEGLEKMSASFFGGPSSSSGNHTLTTVTVPATVTSLESRSFYCIGSLTSIVFKGTVEQWESIEKYTASGNTNWLYGCSNLTKIVCSDGVICMNNGTEVEHAYSNGVCSNCGITPCENGEHTFVENVCADCGKSRCEAEGHAWTGAITCTTVEVCSVCNAERGSLLDHSWASITVEGVGKYQCTVCSSIEDAYVTEDKNLSDQLEGLPTITENPDMTESEMRDIMVDFMLTQLSFAYKADMSTAPNMTYSYYIKNLFSYANYGGGNNVEGVRYDIVDGSYYGGIPYTGNAAGSLYRWLYFYDETTGNMNFSPVINSAQRGNNRNNKDYGLAGHPIYPNIGSAVFGNSCSSSVFWSWARFSTEPASPWTSGWIPSNNYVPIGDYVIVYEENGSINFANTISNKYHISLGTQHANAINSEQTIFSSYAQMLKADGMVQDGHALMITADPCVVYNSDGTINGDESYVIIAEQAAAWYKNGTQEMQYTNLTEDGSVKYQILANLPGIYKDKYGTYEDQTEYVTWTFTELYDEGFLPFTTPELAGIKEVEAVEVNATNLDKDAETITIAELNSVTVSSNYYMSHLSFTVTDEAGNVVFEAMHAKNSDTIYKSLSIKDAFTSSILYDSYTYIKDNLAYFTDGTYTVTVECTVASGDTVEIYSGTLVG